MHRGTAHRAVASTFRRMPSFRRADIAHAFGVELSLDTVIGYSLPVTFTGGAAHRTLPGGSRTVFFTRIGRAF